VGTECFLLPLPILEIKIQSSYIVQDTNNNTNTNTTTTNNNNKYGYTQPLYAQETKQI